MTSYYGRIERGKSPAGPQKPSCDVVLCSPRTADFTGNCIVNDVTRILMAIEDGDQHATDQLLPLVYDELRKLAAVKLKHEKVGQTLDATALVHEAYVRLVRPSSPAAWDGRNHFFVAAAEAM